MARRKRGGIASFFEGFNQGYETVNRVMRDKDLADIEREKESTQFSEDQGQQLQAIADSGQYDIGIKTKEDGTFDSYTITPKTIAERGISGVAPEQAAASDASRMTGGFQPEITKYLGNEYKGGVSQSQKDRAKLIAQSGVLSKYGDPMEAQKLRQQAAQSEQMEKQGVLTDLQIGRAKREEETQTKLGEVNDAVAAYMKNRVKLGEDGQPLPLTDEDFVMAGKQRVFELANRGLFDQAGAAAKESMDYATKKIQAETVERQAAVRDAVARIAQGDYASAMSVFNKYVPDGNIVQNVIQNKDGSLTLERISGVDGTKLPPAKVESVDKLVASIQTLADPNALTQYVERTFRNDIETRRLKLSENADGRAGATFAQGQADRAEAQKDKQAKADAAVAIAEERAKAQGKTLSDAERNAIRTGILEAVPKEGSITSDYKPDSFGTGGTAIQKDKNGNIVVTRVDSGKPGQSFSIAPPGAKPAQQSTRKVGEEQIIQAGTNKGKRAVWDGQGWVLKP
jgi:hypothetical protein